VPAPSNQPIIEGLAANGIPKVSLNAYRLAAARMGTALPACGIDWSLLAAIGRVESDHGQFAGSVLLADGTSTPHIIGIALDGTRSALIGDSDGGRLDGDVVFDHAVGPMQFIPATWVAYQADGNGDRIADPFNVYDAALAAARYLCTAGGDLRARPGQIAAVLAYNDSDQYLAQVLALAGAYARGIPVAGLPITGPTTGKLPPVDTGVHLPVNPAPPPAGAKNPPKPKPHPTPTHASGSATPPGTRPAPAPTPSTPAPSTGNPTSATGTPGPTPISPGPATPPSDPPSTPAPVQTVIGGVLCTISLLGIPICPGAASGQTS
jgi:hypothetical protein